MRVCAYFGISADLALSHRVLDLAECGLHCHADASCLFSANDWSTGRSCGDDYSLPTVP